MNSDQLEGKWKQLKGAAKQHWGKLTDDDMDVIAGRHEQLVGKIQERYGIAREEAIMQANAWIKNMEDQVATGMRGREYASGKH